VRIGASRAVRRRPRPAAVLAAGLLLLLPIAFTASRAARPVKLVEALRARGDGDRERARTLFEAVLREEKGKDEIAAAAGTRDARRRREDYWKPPSASRPGRPDGDAGARVRWPISCRARRGAGRDRELDAARGTDLVLRAGDHLGCTLPRPGTTSRPAPSRGAQAPVDPSAIREARSPSPIFRGRRRDEAASRCSTSRFPDGRSSGGAHGMGPPENPARTTARPRPTIP
jgi:hypothetical protein